MSCLPQPRLLLPPAIIVHTSRFQIDQRNVFYLHILPYLGLVSGNARMLQMQIARKSLQIDRSEVFYLGIGPRASRYGGLWFIFLATHVAQSALQTMFVFEPRVWYPCIWAQGKKTITVKQVVIIVFQARVSFLENLMKFSLCIEFWQICSR